MSTAERDKWDARYRDGAYEDRTHPTALLAEWLPRMPARPRARRRVRRRTQRAVSRGARLRVTALDISAVALERGRRAAAERGLDVEWLCADLDEDVEHALPAGGFDLIVWVRYVHPQLMPHLVARLDVGGTLLCEQHLATTAQVAGPTSAAFGSHPATLARDGAALAGTPLI